MPLLPCIVYWLTDTCSFVRSFDAGCPGPRVLAPESAWLSHATLPIGHICIIYTTHKAGPDGRVDGNGWTWWTDDAWIAFCDRRLDLVVCYSCSCHQHIGITITMRWQSQSHQISNSTGPRLVGAMIVNRDWWIGIGEWNGWATWPGINNNSLSTILLEFESRSQSNRSIEIESSLINLTNSDLTLKVTLSKGVLSPILIPTQSEQGWDL